MARLGRVVWPYPAHDPAVGAARAGWDGGGGKQCLGRGGVADIYKPQKTPLSRCRLKNLSFSSFRVRNLVNCCCCSSRVQMVLWRREGPNFKRVYDSVAVTRGASDCYFPSAASSPSGFAVFAPRSSAGLHIYILKQRVFCLRPDTPGPVLGRGQAPWTSLRRTTGPPHGRPQGRHAACPSRLSCACTAPPRGAFAGHGYEVLEASGE